jgi:hypothetical protein
VVDVGQEYDKINSIWLFIKKKKNWIAPKSRVCGVVTPSTKRSSRLEFKEEEEPKRSGPHMCQIGKRVFEWRG